MKVEATIHFGKQGTKKQAQKANPPVAGRTPRIAKLMALAIRFEGLIADGTVSDYSELAKLAQVSRARMTQIMNLCYWHPIYKRNCCSCSELNADAIRLSWRTCSRWRWR